MSKTILGLADYARAGGVTPKQFLEETPHRDEIIEGYRRGIGPATIYRWLVDVAGYKPDELPKITSFSRYLQSFK